jgi:hypothetical protein
MSPPSTSERFVVTRGEPVVGGLHGPTRLPALDYLPPTTFLPYDFMCPLTCGSRGTRSGAHRFRHGGNS